VDLHAQSTNGIRPRVPAFFDNLTARGVPMRAMSYVLIILGIYLLASAGFEKIRGKTPRPFRYVPFSQRSLLENDEVDPTYKFSAPVLKSKQPEMFRGFINAHWLYAFIIEFAGICLWAAQDSWKRAWSFMLMVLGIYLLGTAAYQECSGKTIRPVKFMPLSKRDIWDHGANNLYQFSIIVSKNNNPALFREYMNFHWLWAALIEVGGVLLCATEYRLPEPESSDPSAASEG
jgi:hypothetical protein